MDEMAKKYDEFRLQQWYKRLATLMGLKKIEWEGQEVSRPDAQDGDQMGRGRLGFKVSVTE